MEQPSNSVFPTQNCVDVIAWGTFNYAYDNPSTISQHEFIWNQDVEDRAVVVYGRSRSVREKRDWYGMRAPRGEREWGESSVSPKEFGQG